MLEEEKTENVGFAQAEVQRCPYPLIKKLLNEAPVYLDPTTGLYAVTRYDDIEYINNHPELFSNRTFMQLGGRHSDPGQVEADAYYKAHGMPRIAVLVWDDPPTHTRARALVDRVFSPSFIQRIEPYLQNVVDEVIDAFADSTNVDLKTEFCHKIPSLVVIDQLGLSRDRWRTFRSWTEAMFRLLDPSLDADTRGKLVRIHVEAQQFLMQRRHELLNAPSSDTLLSRLANAKIVGESLSEAEFVGIGEQLLAAGHETTSSAFGHAILMLMEDEPLQQALREDSTRIPLFIEEVLRIHSPNPHVYRTVLQDTELAGVKLSKGAVIHLSYMGGNYDETHFPSADKVDLERRGIRTHLSFGRGFHYCIGHLLARAELRIGITRLLERFKSIRLDTDYPAPRIAASYHSHELEALHVILEPMADGAGAK